jgi:phosphopantothenoylcysteine decarboxylase/phosphopantothenate--cysteine ligase
VSPPSAPPAPRPARVLVGVTGGIAAYKAADLTSKLVGAGLSVRVAMTQAATAFVGPLTFEALTGHPVLTQVLATGASPDGASAIEHISWARWPDVVIVAPLSANTLARLAHGLAEDALTTVLHALRPDVPVVLAPAMNTAMWEHPAVVRNLRLVDELGRYRFIAPTAKRLACGEVGVGGLAEVPDLVAAVEAAVAEVREEQAP